MGVLNSSGKHENFGEYKNMATLAEIRAKLQAQEDKKSNNMSGGDNAIYPHWNIDEGQSTRIRFLPDGDEDNIFYWVERLLINLTFSGVKGDPLSKPCTVKVPCMEMWEPVGSCPILAEVRPWFKDPQLEDVARKYWKKRSYFMQGFVHETPLEEETPENPIRRFTFTPQIHEVVKAALMDPELDELPTDYNKGLDFIINKTSGGQFASYATSSYSRKESALTQVELDAIEEYGLYDLKSFLPKKPDAKALDVIKEMFEASVDGEAYDIEKWGEYYKPYGLDVPKTPKADNDGDKKADEPADEKADEPAPVKTPDVDAKEPKSEAPESGADDGTTGNAKAQAILDKIRGRA